MLCPGQSLFLTVQHIGRAQIKEVSAGDLSNCRIKGKISRCQESAKEVHGSVFLLFETQLGMQCEFVTSAFESKRSCPRSKAAHLIVLKSMVLPLNSMFLSFEYILLYNSSDYC